MSIEHLVTIALPTKNESRNLGRFLASLPVGIPLVMVDASTDDTVAVLHATRPAGTRVVRDMGNIPVARQLGAAHANTPWVLFTDADVVFASDYFDRLATLDVGPDVGALYGSKRTSGPYPVYHWLFYLGQWICGRLGIPAGSGSNMLVSRVALADAGGFDAELSCNEDSELLWRVQRAGYRVEFVPALAVISHDHRRLERGAARKLAHSVARCALLYSGLLRRRLRRSDWGYWSR